MRINVYAEELTNEVVFVSKDVEDEEFGKRTFYGLRVFLKSPPELHHSPEDDDRSAITFWFQEGDQAKHTHTTILNMDYAIRLEFSS
jgi:hypothetical protein